MTRKVINRSKDAVERIDLLCPQSWLFRPSTDKGKDRACLFCGTAAALGITFNMQYPFPYFPLFSIAFFLIGICCIIAERYFIKEMQEIRATLNTQKSAMAANGFMTVSGAKSPVFVLAPLFTVLFFGTGGCLMFGAIVLTPTLIWVLILFAVVVYISIVGYWQYICLAIYIARLARAAGTYKGLDKRTAHYVPADIPWIKRLTKLSHIYRSVFFTLGCAYIIAFAAFCYLPETQADTNSIFYFLMWGVIIVAIVLTFPLVSVLEHRWIRMIVKKLKESFVSDLEAEYMLFSKASFTQLAAVVLPINVREIMCSKDYPIASAWSTGYAAVLSILNLAATMTTLFTDTATLITGIRLPF